MWAIVTNCGKELKDIDRRDECLDTFHRLVYQELLKGKEKDFEFWSSLLDEQYKQFNEAMKTEHELGSLWNLAAFLNKKLYGQLELDAFVQFEMENYIRSSMEDSLKLIDSYEWKQ